MVIEQNASCRFFFGDSITCPIGHQSTDFVPFCDDLRKQCKLDSLAILNQTHGTDGWVIEDKKQCSKPILYKEMDGDFLITNQANVGIGVLTADCLPIIFYVPNKNVVAIAHAGWRGSLAGIGREIIKILNDKYKIKPQDIFAYLGPSAKSCCYTVKNDFVSTLKEKIEAQKIKNFWFNYIIKQHGSGTFFDNPKLNTLQLIDAGLAPAHIIDRHNQCTLCNFQFYSYRRCENKEDYSAQLSFVWLAPAQPLQGGRGRERPA